MRLVDADALIAQIEENICKPCIERKEDYNRVRCRACQYGDEIDDIDSAPTIERKTGKWIRETKHYKDSEQEFYYYEERCSECGTKRKIGWAGVRYCPMCGTRLVQEGEDNDS